MRERREGRGREEDDGKAEIICHLCETGTQVIYIPKQGRSGWGIREGNNKCRLQGGNIKRGRRGK